MSSPPTTTDLQLQSQLESNFKAALPPRKRAKTQEEKEQRRIERILRNRRAAHASREKKRKHVEYLETYVQALEAQVALVQANQAILQADCNPSPATLAKLAALEDLSEHKENCCLTSTATTGTTESKKRKLSNGMDDEDDEDDEDEESMDDAAHPLVKTEAEQRIPPPLTGGVKLEAGDSPLVSNQRVPSSLKNQYYSYLSPVSINSPTDKYPMELTKYPMELTMDAFLPSPSTTSSQEDLVLFNHLSNTPKTTMPTGMDFTLKHEENESPDLLLFSDFSHTPAVSVAN